MKSLIHAFKQVLIISPEPWDDNFVSKHHYAEMLSKTGSQVYFLNPPNSKLNKVEVLKTNYSNLFEVQSPQVAKGLRFYPRLLKNRLEKKWLKRLESIIGSDFTAIWLFENSRFYDMRFADDRLKIYHQVDLNQNFHIQSSATTADICYCTTSFIQKKLKLYNPSTYKIHHGVNIYSSIKKLPEEKKKSFNIRKINTVMVGNLDICYLDSSLLVAIIEKHSLVTFHLVGQYNENGEIYQKLKQFDNICWWGRVDSGLILEVLLACDVSLLLYKTVNSLDKQQLASPHKIMEYFASGKVTVATYTDEYKDKRHLLEMVDDNNKYISKFDEVIDNLSDYNSTEKQMQRKQFAQENTYEEQLNRIIAYLRKHNLTQ